MQFRPIRAHYRKFCTLRTALRDLRRQVDINHPDFKSCGDIVRALVAGGLNIGSQPIDRVVSDCDRVIGIFVTYDAENWLKDFFAPYCHIIRDIAQDSRLHIIAGLKSLFGKVTARLRLFSQLRGVGGRLLYGASQKIIAAINVW